MLNFVQCIYLLLHSPPSDIYMGGGDLYIFFFLILNISTHFSIHSNLVHAGVLTQCFCQATVTQLIVLCVFVEVPLE